MDKNDASPINLCPKCKGDMEPGRLMGMKFINFVSDSERNKIIGKDNKVAVYRCKKCGFCEIYAQVSP